MDIDEAPWMFEWSKDLNNFLLAAPFTGDSGLKLPINFPATPTPADFYQTETNRYAAAVCNQRRLQVDCHHNPFSTNGRELPLMR